MCSSAKGFDDDYDFIPAAAEAESTGDLKFISIKQLKFGDMIAEGRFAVIRKGQLMQVNETTLVATKGLIRESFAVVYSILLCTVLIVIVSETGSNCLGWLAVVSLSNVINTRRCNTQVYSIHS